MIRFQNVTCQYDDSPSAFALREISFDFHAGERVALMGSNGSGKTTLIHALLGLMALEKGRIFVDDIPVGPQEQLFEVRRRVGLMFQNPDNQMVTTTVERELAFGLENLATPVDEMRERVERALHRFNLTQYRHAEPHLLSGGERQRLALASVWVMQPQYLILDEPTSLLDPRNRREVLRLLEREIEGEGMGILLVTQLPDEALQCDRLLVLEQGRLVLDGPPAEIFRDRARFQSMGLDIPVSMIIDQMMGGTS